MHMFFEGPLRGNLSAEKLDIFFILTDFLGMVEKDVVIVPRLASMGPFTFLTSLRESENAGQRPRFFLRPQRLLTLEEMGRVEPQQLPSDEGSHRFIVRF